MAGSCGTKPSRWPKIRESALQHHRPGSAKRICEARKGRLLRDQFGIYGLLDNIFVNKGGWLLRGSLIRGSTVLVFALWLPDYRFLEDVIRKADAAARDIAPRKRDRSKYVSNLYGLVLRQCQVYLDCDIPLILGVLNTSLYWGLLFRIISQCIFFPRHCLFSYHSTSGC